LRKIGETASFCGESRGKRRKKTAFFEKIPFRLFYFGRVSGMLKNREFVFEFSPATVSPPVDAALRLRRREARPDFASSGGVWKRRWRPFLSSLLIYKEKTRW